MNLLGFGDDGTYSNPEVESCFDSLYLITEEYSGSLDFCEARFGDR